MWQRYSPKIMLKPKKLLFLLGKFFRFCRRNKKQNGRNLSVSCRFMNDFLSWLTLVLNFSLL